MQTLQQEREKEKKKATNFDEEASFPFTQKQ